MTPVRRVPQRESKAPYVVFGFIALLIAAVVGTGIWAVVQLVTHFAG